MTRKRKKIIILVAAMALAGAGGLAVWARSESADRKVERLLQSLDPPDRKGLLQKLGLSKRRQKPATPEAVLAEIRAMGPSAIPALARVLETRDTTTASFIAIKALGAFKDPRVVEPLAKCLGHPFRSSLATASFVKTIRLGNTPALDRLMKIASHRRSGEGRAAILALALSEDDRAVAFITDRLASGDRACREDILVVLSMVPARWASDAVVGALGADDEHVRIRAAYALAVIGDAEGIAKLASALKEAHGPFRQAVLDAFGALRSLQSMTSSRPAEKGA